MLGQLEAWGWQSYEEQAQGEAEVKEFRLVHVKSEASNLSFSRVATENSEFLLFSQAMPF